MVQLFTEKDSIRDLNAFLMVVFQATLALYAFAFFVLRRVSEKHEIYDPPTWLFMLCGFCLLHMTLTSVWIIMHSFYCWAMVYRNFDQNENSTRFNFAVIHDLSRRCYRQHLIACLLTLISSVMIAARPVVKIDFGAAWSSFIQFFQRGGVEPPELIFRAYAFAVSSGF